MKLTKKINYILFIVVSCLSIYLGIQYIQNKDTMKLLITLTIIPSMIIPYYINKILKYKISEGVITLYLLFVVGSIVLGSLFDFYHVFPMFDKFMHFITGIMSSMIGIIILINFKIYDNTDIKFNIIFMAAITSMIALLWEVFEYSSDFVFAGNAQRVLESGVNDTMLDMISSLIGFVIFVIIYMLIKKTKISFIISND